MVIRNVPMYQAKIPIRGGGGLRHIDLREREGPNPIVAALQQMVERKRQQEQDELDKRFVEARIGQMQRPKQPSMKIVVGEGKTWLVNPATGEKRDLGIAPPKSKVGDRKISDIINEMSKIGTLPKGTLPEEAETELIGSLLQELLGERGLEEGEEEYTHDPWWGKPRTKTRKVIRKKVKSTPITQALGEPTTATHPRTDKKIQIPTAKAERHLVRKTKERPPKPAEYPDAVWSEEHQMWTIVKNGRLMGVK